MRISNMSWHGLVYPVGMDDDRYADDVDASPFYTYADVAAIFRVTKGTVCRWVKRGTIRVVRINSRVVLIHGRELDRLAG